MPPLEVIALPAAVTFLVVSGYILYKLGQNAGVIKGRTEAEEKRLPARAPQSTGQATPGWFWLLLIGGIAIAFWLNGSSNHPKKVGPPPVAVLFPWMLLGVIVLSVFLLAFLSVDRVLHRAIKQANAGDPETAIAWLQAAIQKKRSAERLNLLACLYLFKKQFLEAHDLLLEAQRLGLDQTIFQSNLALAYKGLGRFEEALALLELQVNRPKAMLTEICLYCELLIELKQYETARIQLARAEQLHQQSPGQPPAVDMDFRARLDACRLQLSGVLPVKAKDLFAEL